MSQRLDWSRDGADWPNRELSRFVETPGLRWHVQVGGKGPVILLLHGTGASTHSWGALIPLLTSHFTVVAPDLPGHAFTSMPAAEGLTLSGMARETSELVHKLALDPVLIAGHSAGAAVAIQTVLDRQLTPSTIVSINGALLPFGTPVSRFFSPLAKMIAATPLLTDFFAWRAKDREAVERVIEGTGSQLGAKELDYYWRLFRNPGHVEGALKMMANWDLTTLDRDLPSLPTRLILIAASADRAVAPSVAMKIASLAPHATVVTLTGAGHLAHEEKPTEVANIIVNAADQTQRR